MISRRKTCGGKKHLAILTIRRSRSKHVFVALFLRSNSIYYCATSLLFLEKSTRFSYADRFSVVEGYVDRVRVALLMGQRLGDFLKFEGRDSVRFFNATISGIKDYIKILICRLKIFTRLFLHLKGGDVSHINGRIIAFAANLDVCFHCFPERRETPRD